MAKRKLKQDARPKATLETPEAPKATPSRDDIVRRRAAFELLMAECGVCQTTVSAHWQFCAHCGIRLATECPGCGEPLPPLGAKFCPHCGVQIPRVQ